MNVNVFGSIVFGFLTWGAWRWARLAAERLDDEVFYYRWAVIFAVHFGAALTLAAFYLAKLFYE